MHIFFSPKKISYIYIWNTPFVFIFLHLPASVLQAKSQWGHFCYSPAVLPGHRLCWGPASIFYSSHSEYGVGSMHTIEEHIIKEEGKKTKSVFSLTGIRCYVCGYGWHLQMSKNWTDIQHCGESFNNHIKGEDLDYINIPTIKKISNASLYGCPIMSRKNESCFMEKTNMDKHFRAPIWFCSVS